MLHVELESTDRSTTVFVTGTLSLPGLWQILATCNALEPEIRHLRVDLRDVRLLQGGVIEALATGLRHWRAARSGSTRVDLPPAGLTARLMETVRLAV